MTQSSQQVDGQQKFAADNKDMITLRHNPRLHQLDTAATEFTYVTLAAVLARPRTMIEFPDGVGADALHAALALTALEG